METIGIVTRVSGWIGRMVTVIFRAISRFPAWLDTGPRPEARARARRLILERRLGRDLAGRGLPVLGEAAMQDAEPGQAPVDSLEGTLFTPYRGGFS